jgi:hypothetical protein
MVTINVKCGKNIEIILAQPVKGYVQKVTESDAQYIF